MTNYIIRRLLQAGLVLLLLSFVSFALMSLMPGDPVELAVTSNPNLRPEDVARLKKLYGLDNPIHERYWNWLVGTPESPGVLRGELGYSRTYKIPVTDLVWEKLINTFVLSFSSLILSTLIAIPLGMLCALKVNSRVDYLLSLFSFAGISAPLFWIGIMLILIFSVYLGWFPAGGTYSIGTDLSGFAYILDRLKYLALPLISFTIYEIAVVQRFTRGAMLEVLRQDYMRTAKAKGLSRRRVIVVHGLRNALIPIVTLFCLQLGFVFGGAIITEQVFAYQGMGKLLLDSVINNDSAVAMVSFNLTIIMVQLSNLLADILYGVLDPRISYS